MTEPTTPDPDYDPNSFGSREEQTAMRRRRNETLLRQLPDLVARLATVEAQFDRLAAIVQRTVHSYAKFVAMASTGELAGLDVGKSSDAFARGLLDPPAPVPETEPAPRPAGAVKCGQATCDETATHRFLWLGDTEAKPACERCAQRAKQIARHMGFVLHVEPIQ